MLSVCVNTTKVELKLTNKTSLPSSWGGDFIVEDVVIPLFPDTLGRNEEQIHEDRYMELSSLLHDHLIDSPNRPLYA
jgi:hypothetical protein